MVLTPCRFTKPGGWAEFQDFDVLPRSDDGSLKEGNQVLKLQTLAAEACEKMGRTGRPGPKLKGLMQEAGYKNITERIFKLPIGMWPQNKRLVSLVRDRHTLLNLILFRRNKSERS